jgi:hypothetical protein
MLQMLEYTEKNTLIGEFQIVVLSYLLTADSDRQEHCMECDEMLTVHVLCE